ncbi:uncharacterized protein LOC123223958 [Mangifera indica]|uniref:uncharacterized protein LOC123223958 n=1 Tax=Mangifera indica TaxID=29780 RepID=UPI001CFAD88F|nr:uncharacterized protein LOC123223958 [Mangifera indica]
MQKEDNGIDSFSSSVSFCLSFNSYASAKLADIASKVGQEEQRNDDGDDDFEFVSIKNDPDAFQFSFDGQIPQGFPVFNQDLLLDNDQNDDDDQKIRLPLKNLFIEGDPPSSSSSDADELEGLPEETYCVWVPNKNNSLESCPSPNRCQKSNSTGSSSSSAAARSSKRWFKFRDLLKRSNSDGGKDPYAFLNKPKTNPPPPPVSVSKAKESMSEVKATVKTKPVSAHEAFYVKNRAIKQGDKKKSYLPYRQDLLGFFASNVNSMGKSFPPF